MSVDYLTISDEELNELDVVESDLSSLLDEQLSELETLESDYQSIGNPDKLGDAILNVVWEQFINQIGVYAGKEFISDNKGLNLDLRNSAHIQTTENFKKGKISKHNQHIDYAARYESWQNSFELDKDGSVKMHFTRGGRLEANVNKQARKPFDVGRPKGSIVKGTDMDHTIPAAEIIRDPAANAHLSNDEQVAFANSEVNLQEMNASHNRSKGDTPMQEWLDNPNSKGQKPSEIYDIPEELEQQYRKKDKQAREEYDKRKEEGEQHSIEVGRKSQREEALRIGGKAAKAVVMTLLADLAKEVIQKLVAWFRETKRTFKALVEKIKDAFNNFFTNIKTYLLNAGNTLMTTIATAILGPIVDLIKKVWIILKQGAKSVKDAIHFLRDPNNNDMPLSLKLLEVGKIVVVGLAAIGSLAIGEFITKALESIGLSIQIPLIGSLASVLGVFMGALVSGIAGAIALYIIDKSIANKLRTINRKQQFIKRNEIISTQHSLLAVTQANVQAHKENVILSISERHKEARDTLTESIKNIINSSDSISNNERKFNDIFNGNNDDLNKLLDAAQQL